MSVFRALVASSKEEIQQLSRIHEQQLKDLERESSLEVQRREARY
jgi:hypothetical protein